MATLQMKIDRVHAEFLAGNAVSSTVTTHSVVARDGNGNVHANKFKSANMELAHVATERTSDTVFYSSVDDVIRKNTAAGMRGSLGLNNVNNTGATVAATADKIVLRDSEGGIFAAGVTIADNPGTLFSYSDGTRSVYGGCDSNDPWFGTSSNHDLRLVTYGGERMRIDNTGNVGIGVTDPDQKLEVRGNIKASYSDTNHGMFLDAGGTLRRDYGGAGAGFHFTNTAIWPTDYLGDYSAGGINFGDSSYRWNNVYTEELNASGEVITGTVNATSYKLTGDTTPHKQSIKNSANLSVGWYRIAENGNAVDTDANGSRCSARFTIIDYDSGRHSTRTLYAGGTYGNKPFIHLLTNTSYSGDGIISKVRVVEGSTYEGLAVEIYVDTACSTNEIRIVMDDNYQGNGFTMVDFESVVADHSNMNEYELDLNTTFWGMFLDNTTKNICMLEDGNVGIGTDTPAYTLDVHGTANVGALTATSVSGDGSGLTSLNGTRVTSGTVAAGRIANLNASKITAGTLGTDRIPNLSATKITSGTLTRPISTTTGTFSGDVVTGNMVSNNWRSKAFSTQFGNFWANLYFTLDYQAFADIIPGNQGGSTRLGTAVGYYGRGYFDAVYRNSESTLSDDRVKYDEILIDNATSIINKLKPQTYTKRRFIYHVISDDEYSNIQENNTVFCGKTRTYVDRDIIKPNTLNTDEPWFARTLSTESNIESGLIAQDIWYNCPELRYIVNISDDASPAEEKPIPETDDIQQDPDYDAAGWGTTAASINYTNLIPYLIKSNQELHERIKVLENLTN